MRKSISLKMLFRSPLKTLLTFLLVAAATFALFSRVLDYAITMQGTKNMEGNYHCIASLNNEVQDLYYQVADVESRDKFSCKGYEEKQEVPDKPWPSEQKLEEFASLPGVTLSDTRYMTAGLVEDYKRPLEYESLSRYIPIVFEGTFAGYEDDTQDDILEGHIRLEFDDVKVIACEEKLDIGTSIKLAQAPLGDNYYIESPYTREFFDSIKEGSKCFVLGYYAGFTSDTPVGFYLDCLGEVPQYQGYLRVIDGLPDNYLETEDFAREKGWVDAIEQGCYIYDMIYTSDMRALGYKAGEGCILTQGDTDVCYVHETFLEDHNLSVGDTINVRLGDRICANNYSGGVIDGARAYEGKDMPEFSDAVALTIVGASDNFPESWIYVPDTLLKAKVPDDYEMPWQDYSVYVEDAQDIERFLEAAEAFAEELDLKLDYSDDGWMDVKDSFRRGTQTLFLTLVLYVVGAVLALTLAVYLYVGRSRKNYAIMRTLGVPGRVAGRSVVMPFALLSVFAVPLGSISGLFYAREIAAGTLTGIMESVSEEYVPDTTLPIGVVALCIVLELLFLSLATYSFLWKMKKTPPLELLQEGTAHKRALKGTSPDVKDSGIVPAGIDLAKISVSEEDIPRGNYGAARHVASYILRHMKRGVGKTAVSLILAIVLAGGIGMSVLARYIYQDAYYQYGVETEATQYAYTSVVSLSNSPLVKDFYCHHTLDVHVKGTDDNIFMMVSNDLVRYLGDDCTVDYADGYDISAFEGTGPLCLVGKEFAEELNVGLGDEIGMLSGTLYYMLQNAEKKGETGSLENGYKPYKVIGIVDSGDETVDHAIFTGIRTDLTNLCGSDFMFDECKFLLADNDRVSDLEALLEEEMNRKIVYAPYAMYQIDSEGLANITRIQELLEVLFPIAVVAAVLIGVFAPLLIILQSAQEAAFLRILGTTKKRVRCMLMFEQVILSIAGVILVAGGIALISPGLFAKSQYTLAACFGLYLLGGVCGAAAAAVQVTRHKVLELLQVRE